MEKEYRDLSPDEKKIDLYVRQKNTLDTFLARNAITQTQYNKSLGDLTDKMGMHSVLAKLNEGSEK